VGGSTLHSLLKLPVHQKNGKNVRDMPMLTRNYLRLMRNEWKDIEFFFIEETFMIPYEMLCMIDWRLKQLKNNMEPFEGINNLVFGGLMQLPPVRGRQVLQLPTHLAPATHFWPLFRLIELSQHATTWRYYFYGNFKCAQNWRTHSQSHSYLDDIVNVNMVGEFSIERALRIYPTNQQVNENNRKVLEHFGTTGAEIFKIRAQDQLVDATRPLKDGTSLDTIT